MSTTLKGNDKKRIAALKRAVKKARNFPKHTSPASRHVLIMADELLRDGCPMLTEEPERCAESMLAVVGALWEARSKLAAIREGGAPIAKETDK